MINAPHQKLFVFIKWRIMIGRKRLAHARRREKHTAFWLVNVKERDHLEDLGADGKIIIMMSIFQKCCWRVFTLINLALDRPTDWPFLNTVMNILVP